MAFTMNDLTSLEAALKQGATSVQYQDRKVTYMSLDKMIQLRNMMRKELGLANNGPHDLHLSFRKDL